MKTSYILKWFDQLISITLNPQKTDISRVTTQQVQDISRTVSVERDRITLVLIENVFSLKKEQSAHLIIQNHYSSLHFLLTKCSEYESHESYKNDIELTVMLATIKGSLLELVQLLEDRFAAFIPVTIRNDNEAPEPLKSVPKLLIHLSADQIALILRAALDQNLLKAKSMNTLFKTVVPFLSTPQKRDLSFDAMRSKSYAAERTDKNAAMRALQQLIDQIASY